MSESTTKQNPQDPEAEQKAAADRRREFGLPADAPEELLEAAEADVLDKGDPEGGEKEAKVLDFLLGPTTAIEYDVETLVDTPTGREAVTFHLKQIPDDLIYKLEDEHTDGIGPFATIDRPRLNAAKVAAAAIYIKDASGRKVELASNEFRGVIPDTAEALRGRFRFQPGIISMLAQEVDAIAGMSNDRVGRATRSVQEQTIAKAVGNS